MYPKSVDPHDLQDLVEKIAAAFRQSPGFLSMTTSVDALLGPGAESGDFGRVVIVDFDTLENALNALQAKDFQDVATASESLTSAHFLFESREV
jgi:uncharacterized protein (DUF1330 family)